MIDYNSYLVKTHRTWSSGTDRDQLALWGSIITPPARQHSNIKERNDAQLSRREARARKVLLLLLLYYYWSEWWSKRSADHFALPSSNASAHWHAHGNAHGRAHPARRGPMSEWWYRTRTQWVSGLIEPEPEPELNQWEVSKESCSVEMKWIHWNYIVKYHYSVNQLFSMWI